MCLALRQYGIESYCVNELPLLERYKYLDQDDVVIGLEDFKTNYPDFSPQMVIVVDTNTLKRVGTNLQHFLKEQSEILYIDHHPVRGRDLSLHCIDTKAAATGQIVGEIIEHLGISFSKKIALPLYTSIIIDTSSFRYPTVSGSTHRLVSKLLDTGVSPPEAYNGIYGTKKVQHMHLLSVILKTASTNKDETIAWISLNKKDIDKFLSDVEDTHSFINHLLILNNIRVACMFRDDGPIVKVSLRSSGEYDVGEIAQTLGGGGHSHSAATVVVKNQNETLSEIIERVILKIEKFLLENP